MNPTQTIWAIITTVALLTLLIRIISAYVSAPHSKHKHKKSHFISLSHEWEEFFAPGDTFKTNGYGPEDDDFDDM